MYRIIGADGNEYGPISAEQVRQWFTEGRVVGTTLVQAEGSPDWRQLSTYSELSAAPSPVAYPTQRKTNGMAIAGLVLGILAFIQCCTLLVGTLGIVFSCIAISQINKQPAEFTGKGMAVAGLITSAVGMLFNIALLIVYLAMFRSAILSR